MGDLYRISITRRDLWRGFPIIADSALAERENRFLVPGYCVGALDNAGIQYKIVSYNGNRHGTVSRQ